MASNLGTPPFNPSTPPLPFIPCTPPLMFKLISPSEEAAVNLLDMTVSSVADLSGNINSAMYSAKEAIASIHAIVQEEIAETLGDIKNICDEVKDVSEQLIVLKEIIDKMSADQQACMDDLYNEKYSPSENDPVNNRTQNLQHFIAVFLGMVFMMYINYIQTHLS